MHTTYLQLDLCKCTQHIYSLIYVTMHAACLQLDLCNYAFYILNTKNDQILKYWAIIWSAIINWGIVFYNVDFMVNFATIYISIIYFKGFTAFPLLDEQCSISIDVLQVYATKYGLRVGLRGLLRESVLGIGRAELTYLLDQVYGAYWESLWWGLGGQS